MGHGSLSVEGLCFEGTPPISEAQRFDQHPPKRRCLPRHRFSNKNTKSQAGVTSGAFLEKGTFPGGSAAELVILIWGVSSFEGTVFKG